MTIRSCLLLLVALVARSISAQDLILTNAGDSIHCVITTVGQSKLFYTVKDAQGERRDNIDLAYVAMYKRQGYFPVIMNDVAPNAQRRRSVSDRWRFSATGGWSYRTAKLPDGLPAEVAEFYDGQRAGMHAGASLHMAINEEVSLGLAYSSFFGAANSTEITAMLVDSSTVTGKWEEDVRLRWIPLQVMFEPMTDGAVGWYGLLGIGPMFYRNNATLINKLTITGTDLGVGTALGISFRISDKSSLGAQLSYVVGEFTELKFDYGSAQQVVRATEGSGEGVNRLDLGLALRLRL